MTGLRRKIFDINNNELLYRTVLYLERDRKAHIQAHGSWNLDAGKLYAALSYAVRPSVASSATCAAVLPTTLPIDWIVWGAE